MKVLDAKFLKKFLKTATDQLAGDWVLIGGTLLPALGIDHRVTTDIDMISLQREQSSKLNLQLMELAEQQGLPAESINQAAAYFLEKIPHYRKSLVLLQEGKKGKIFRPNATLYLLLKIKRMSESDFSDCIHWLKWMRKQKEKLDIEVVLKNIEIEKSKSNESPSKFQYLIQLSEALRVSND